MLFRNNSSRPKNKGGIFLTYYHLQNHHLPVLEEPVGDNFSSFRSIEPPSSPSERKNCSVSGVCPSEWLEKSSQFEGSYDEFGGCGRIIMD